jgi:hypothetical protein
MPWTGLAPENAADRPVRQAQEPQAGRYRAPAECRDQRADPAHRDRNEHHSRLAVLAPGIVGHKQGRRPRARAQYLLRGLQEGSHLRIAVGRPLNRAP